MIIFKICNLLKYYFVSTLLNEENYNSLKLTLLCYETMFPTRLDQDLQIEVGGKSVYLILIFL